MREILFRGKTEQGEWVFGSLTIAGDDKAWILKPICTLSICGEDIKTDFDSFKVIPSTIGQYTGLTDKNGTKIFEGDLVDYFNHSKAEIKYWNGSFMIWTKEMFDLLVNPQGEIKVIGNIHEEVQE